MHVDDDHAGDGTWWLKPSRRRRNGVSTAVERWLGGCRGPATPSFAEPRISILPELNCLGALVLLPLLLPHVFLLHTEGLQRVKPWKLV